MSSDLPNFNNDFNYPPLSRKDLMYLDSIKSRDFPIKRLNQINSKRDWSANLYNLDIEKSVPYRSNIYTNKIDFINKLDDIEDAHPKKEKILVKPNFILNVHDIDKAFPNKEKKISQRHVNPLNPVYKLPSFPVPAPPTPLKFIRDQMDISDIEKAKPNKLYPMKMRPMKTYDEIEGNHPKKPYVRKQFYDSFNYDDINKKKRIIRNTNPLDPDYGKDYGGYIEGTKPYLPFYDFKFNVKNSLYNKDIDGTLPGSKNHYSNYRYDNKERYETKDILGASADTKRYGIFTKRCTNPLRPNYQYIGNSENLDCFGTINYKNDSNNINKNDQFLTRTISHPNLGNFENFANNHYHNYIKNNYNDNIKNNLYNSQDFHNIERNVRNNRKIYKSQSYVQAPDNKIDINNVKKVFNNNVNSFQTNFEINSYKKPFYDFENKNNPTSSLRKSTDNNRLNDNIQNIEKLPDLNINNKNNFNNNYNHKLNKKINIQNDNNSQKDFPIYGNQNEFGTLYQKYKIDDENNIYDDKFNTLINK